MFSDTDDIYSTGEVVRFDVEASGENIISGTIRITSASQGYDSSVQNLTFGSIFYHWGTTGLNPSDDYLVEVSLIDAVGQTITDDSLTITLTHNPPAINKLVSDVDISVHAQGLPVRVVRTYILDLGFDGPLGFGWTHTYLMQIVETPDGLVKVFNADGSGSFFKPNGVNTYESPKGDFRTLTKNADGSYELREKFGTIFDFDSNGMLTGIENRNGNILTLVYDSNNLLDTITDSSGQITRFFYNADNRLSSITDPAGRSVYYEYDGSGNLATFTNTGGLQTPYTYDTNRNLTTITDPAGRRTFFTVYADDRLESVSGEGGNNKVTYKYEIPAPDQMTVTDALGNKTIQTYDNNSLITEITDPLGNITSFTYDEAFNLTSLTDGNGSTSTFTYDTHGNVLTSTDAQGNTTTMTYEPLFNQMTSLTDSKGNKTAFDYDSNGNQTSITYPDGSTEAFTHDTSGNLQSKTDRMNQTINFTYDFRGMLTSKLFPDGTSDTFTYDAAGNLLSATDENGTIGFIYDSSDRLTQVTYPGGEVVSYTYDASNNRTQITYPDGAVLDYGYDEANRLAQIGESGQIIAQYAYDQLSRITRRDLGNGNFTTFSYDPSGRLLDLINSKSTSEIISRFSYTYDNVGNRLTMTTLAGTTQYIYDGSNQLTQVVLPDGSTITYNLDPAGNRNSVVVDGSTTGYTTNNLNQYTDVGGDTYTYDANGNLTSKTSAQGTTIYTYDFENRLIQVGTPTETITYTYDPFGRRASKKASFGTTNYFYDDKRVIMETDNLGAAQATYIYGINLDEVLVMRRGGVDYYYAQDGLGSVTDLADFSENIIESFSYDAYGTPSNQSSVDNPYLFTGREFEPETDMYFYRARYYSPEIGRFITTDPIGFAGGNNLYTYVSNNPINFVDPSGLQHTSSSPPTQEIKCAVSVLGCEAICMRFGGGPQEVCEDIIPWPGSILCEKLLSCSHVCQLFKAHCSTLRGDPTFIQVSQRQVNKKLRTDLFSKNDGLIAKISVPCEDSLVRGDVPIFGLAYGKNFKEYRVEVGQGANPTKWVTLANSHKPQEKDTSSTVLNDPGDWSVEGNMATWDTGLKNYVYLPSHPEDHPVDLKGIYTIRLVVSGMDGSIAEDRVTVEVANVIPNAWGGKVTSKDGRVVLFVHEQALMDSFRLISVKHADKAPDMADSDRRIIGKIYEFREADEKFTKPAELQMAFTEKDIGGTDPGKLGIYAYSAKTKKWVYLNSQRPENENRVTTKVQKLHPYYALMVSDVVSEGSTVKSDKKDGEVTKTAIANGNGYYLMKNPFEESMGEWANRDGEAGAEVSLADEATFDGTKALKITNTNGGGNFAVNVLTTPFNAKEYPVVQFDYRIPPDVKTNFLVKVSARWYEIGFTDDPKSLRARNVNIANIGDIEGVTADDEWHTAKFNLYDMLKTKTGNTIVEKLIMADWDVGGFMKLQFGHNRKGASYHIDNFIISKEINAGLRMDDNVILIDNFNQKKETNALGGSTSLFTDSEKGRLVTNFSEEALGKGHALALSYDVSQEESFAGYITALNNLDLRDYQTLTMYIRGSEGYQNLLVSIIDRSGNEGKVKVSPYVQQNVTMDWQKAVIPLTAFSNILDWGRVDKLSISFQNSLHTTGTVFIDNMEFHKEFKSVQIQNFELTDESNLLAGKHWTFTHGAASINGTYAKSSPNGVYGISYGGNIGEPFVYGSGLNYSGWSTELKGINCSQCEILTFRIRGAEGGEKPNIYLDDGNFRWSVDIEKYAQITIDWQTVQIPLKDFADYGVDLTHLTELQFVFEWEKMSGTIYLDDIRFQ